MLFELNMLTVEFNEDDCASPHQGCRQRLWQSDDTDQWSLCPEACPEVEDQSCGERAVREDT